MTHKNFNWYRGEKKERNKKKEIKMIGNKKQNSIQGVQFL